MFLNFHSQGTSLPQIVTIRFFKIYFYVLDGEQYLMAEKKHSERGKDKTFRPICIQLTVLTEYPE